MSNKKNWLDDFGVVIDPLVIRTYGYKDYLFDVVIDFVKGEYGYWLYHPSCGIKSFMYGSSMNDFSYNVFLTTVISGLDDDIKFYDEEYNY